MITKEVKELVKLVLKKTPPTNFSLDDAKTALQKELSAITSTKPLWHKNKYDVFQLMQEQIDDILPKRVIDVMGRFAVIEQVAQGDRKDFKKKVGRNRAKAFITQVGLSGVYESFRLDEMTFQIQAKAIGGAARLDWERFLDGRESIDDYFEIILDGLEDAIYIEVQKALLAAWASLPAANKHTANTFDVVEMRKLLNTVRAYADSVVIFCSPEFATEIDPTLLISGYPSVSAADIEDIRTKGYIGQFYGAPVVVFPQSFVTEDNTQKVIDTQVAYVFPAGGEKVVHIIMEGQTQIDDFKGRDRSMEIEAYKKFGVVILNFNNWAMYRNTGIPQEADINYGYPNLG